MLVKNRKKIGNIPKRILFLSLSGIILFFSFTAYRENVYSLENIKVPYSDVDFSKVPATSNSDIIQSEIDQRGYAVGIDLSYCQGDLNYDKLFLQNSDVKFCIIRVNNFWTDTSYSEEDLLNLIKDGNYSKVIDPDFLKQALACKENNIPIGVYFWPTCKNENRTRLETQIIINYLNYIRENYGIYLELPVCIDIEKGDSDELLSKLKTSTGNALDCVQLTIDMLKENNYFPMIYCNEDSNNIIFKDNIITGEKTRNFENVDVWFASHVNDINSIEDLSSRIGDRYIKIIYGHGSVLAQVSDEAILLDSCCIDLDIMYKNLLLIVRESGLNYLDERGHKK